MSILSESRNPVHKSEDKWYFWNETWSDEYGPYDSEKECKQKLREYVKVNLVK